ncbi:MAG: hypothetical protein FLDDKLPJ_02197 [Phycisphaerae bacterium]|nr:hypothetical protein [Phycisphaerae bacterium]
MRSEVEASKAVAGPRPDVRRNDGRRRRRQALVACGWVLGAAAFSPRVDAGVPIPKVLNNDHHFGELWINDVVSHTFRIHNAGDGDLELIDALANCPCLKIERFDRRIGPGQTGEILVGLDTSRYVYGRFNYRLTVFTNVPGDPQLELKLGGVLREHIQRGHVDPVTGRVTGVGAGFRRLTSEQTGRMIVPLSNQTDAPATLVLASPAQQGCFYVDLEELEPGMKWRLVVDAKPPYQPYQNEAVVELATNLKEQPIVRVTCTAYVPPRLEFRPYPLVPNPAFAVREVNFFNNGDRPVKVLDITTDDPRVLADIVEKQPGKHYLLRVVMPIGYVPPPQGHRITVRTDDAEEPTLVLPFSSAGAADTTDETAGASAPAPSGG